MQKIQRICLTCGDIYNPIVGNQKFCSYECSKVFRYYQLKETKLKKCKQCGKKFLSNNKKKVYCSKECQIEHRQNTYKKKEKEKRKCSICGKLFETSHALKKYCSNICYQKAKEKRDGISKPKWE